MTEIRPAQFPDDMAAVQAIFREYVASPSVSLDFQDYKAEFADLPGKYAAPRGQLLLAWKADAVVGCAAFREVDATTCEMKRVYVRPAARGEQLGVLDHDVRALRAAHESSGRAERGVGQVGPGAGGVHDHVCSEVELVACDVVAQTHLAVRGTDRLEELVFNGVAKREANGSVPVVGEEPIVAGTHGHASSNEEGLVTGAGDLKEDLLLTLENDLAVIGSPREIHQAIELDQLLARQRSFRRSVCRFLPLKGAA